MGRGCVGKRLCVSTIIEKVFNVYCGRLLFMERMGSCSAMYLSNFVASGYDHSDHHYPIDNRCRCQRNHGNSTLCVLYHLNSKAFCG
jgi:hypothetical protein